MNARGYPVALDASALERESLALTSMSGILQIQVREHMYIAFAYHSYVSDYFY
jgi:hypothetical protein